MAYIVDPSLDVRIELVSGTESSLSLNSLVRSKVREKIAKISLTAVAFGAITWLTEKTLDYGYSHLLDAVLGHEEAVHVPRKEIESIVQKTIEAYRKQTTRQGERLFMELESDPSIVGIGATRHPGARPDHIIPRAEFHDRAYGAGTAPLLEPAEPTRRSRTTIETLTLVSPVLLQSNRKWRFMGKEGEFGATIKDGLFLDQVLRGLSAIPMVAGIRMEVELQTIEDPIEGGAWLVRERNVLRVRRVIPPSTQLNMDSFPPKR